jgi:hypothetical protein
MTETQPDTFDPISVAPEVYADDEPLPVSKRSIEDLSLSEALARLFRHPLQTWVGLSMVWSRPVAESAAASAAEILLVEERVRRPAVAINWRATVALGLMGMAFLIALVGSLILTSSRDAAVDRNLPVGGALLLMGALAMAAVVIYTTPALRLAPLPTLLRPQSVPSSRDMLARVGLRIVLVVAGVLWTLGAWTFNRDNKFTATGVFCWIMSILTWTILLMDRDVSISRWLRRTSARVGSLLSKPLTIRFSWTAVLLMVILLVGAWFRFTGLGTYPPDMTSDHVEKALDAQKVYEGDREIFFPNNGGREGFQMYYLAVLKSITGMPVGLEFLQIGSGLEGMLMILLAFWMGRAIIGDEDRKLGNLTGLIMAALVAVSFWHVLLSRLGLRIVTTTLITTVVFVFLVRALRYNRRGDYLIAGLALGAGMYMYQAVRMLPLVVIVGFIIAVILRVRSRRDLARYVLNLAALIIVSVAVFVPLGRYMQQYPLVFWERTSGRLFGEEGINDPSLALVNLQKNLPGLADNMRRSLLMFNVRGDMSWFNGAPDGTPELDFFAGALFALGLGLLVVRMIRRRDPADWLLPISIVIVLLPAALSLAYTIEVPSLTRASGSLPMVYLVTALPLALMVRTAQERLPEKWPRYAVYGAVVVFTVLAAATNAYSYFVVAMGDYRDSTLPHRQAGQILKGFADSTGAPGNAFLPAYPNWWDYRALGIEAGDPHWGNIIWRDPDMYGNFLELIRNNNETRYELRPDRQLLFFVNPDDQEFIDLLTRTFPQGTTTKVAAYKPSRDFLLYIAPPVGCDWMVANVGRLPVSCQSADVTPAPPSKQ